MHYECTKENIQTYFNFKLINDPIYGCMGVSELEVALLDTKAMQRLRHIKQMGFSEYVFPGGEHTRFTHSLGVLYIMGRMCDVLFRNGDIEPRDVQKMRVAALLHDVGHYPFSHLGEIVYSFIDQEENKGLICGEEQLNLLCRIANHRKRKPVDHEHLGAKVIEKDPQISKLLQEAEISPKEIGDIITGKIVAGDTTKGNGALYVQMMHSSLDADRIDYLMRDSAQAGVSFGKIELDYIISNIRKENYVYKQNGKKFETPSLVVDSKAQSAVEHFLMGRYFHYSRTVSHKAAIAFEATAKMLMYKTLLSGSVDEKIKNYENIVKMIGTETFYMFNDSLIWNEMYNFAKNSEDDIVRVLWETIGYRKKPASVLELKNIASKNSALNSKKSREDEKYEKTGEVIQKVWKDLANHVQLNPECIGYVEHTVNLEVLPKIVSPEYLDDYVEEVLRDAIKLVYKDGKVKLLALDETSLINKMVGYVSKSTYIFAVGVSDKDMIQSMKTFIAEYTRKEMEEI